MNFHRIILVSAALGIGTIGIGYVLSPASMYGLYDIGIESVNEGNMVRGAYGGLFVTSAVLFLLGAMQEQLKMPAFIYLLTFMLGFASGRTISIIVDGIPGGLILLLLGLEFVYIILASSVLYASRNKQDALS